MATTKNWTGGGNDGDWSNLANWSDATAFANGDTFIVGATNQAIIAGLTHAYTGVTIIVTDGFGGTIGTSSAALSPSSAALIRYAGRGAFAKFGSAGTVTLGDFQHSTGDVTLSGGTWTTLYNSAGSLVIDAAAVVTTLWNLAGSVTAAYNATAITTLNSAGIYAMIRRNITTLNAKRGITIQENNGTTTFTAVGTSNIENGATYNKRSGGTDTTANVFPGGKLTGEKNAGNASGTATISTVNRYVGSTVVATGIAGVPITITTDNPVGGGPGFSGGI